MSEPQQERDLKASIRELAVALEGGLDGHLTPAELQDFLAGDLPEPGRERAEEHLALCRECARAALDLAEEPVRRGDLLTEGELEAQWERFRARVEPAPWWRKGWALAAVLLIAMAIPMAWVIWKSAQPQTGVVIVDLFPGTLRSSEEPERIPSGADVIVLTLYGVPKINSEYRVEIRSEDGREIRSQSGIQRKDDRVAFGIPASDLPPGTYRIILSAPQGEPVEYVARIEVVPAR